MSEGVLHITDSRTSLNYDIPIRRNTIKATDFQAIKVSCSGSDPADQLLNGLRVYDPGLKNTAVSESKITFLDGIEGVLQYRGRSIADIWETADFEDILHLLVWGNWPSLEVKEALRHDLAMAAQVIPQSVAKVIHAFPRDAPPMQMIIAGLAAYLSESPETIPAYVGRNVYHGHLPIVDTAIIRTLASLQVCVGLAASHRAGIPSTSIEIGGSYVYNTLLAIGKVDKVTRKPKSTLVHQLQRFWALGADLGHTNSTSAFLLGASSLSDPLSCLISALSSGYGILHFGAAEASYRSLAAIGRKENVPHLIDKVKRREARLFGYGHRMFRAVDPRIAFAGRILDEIEPLPPLVEVAKAVDDIACKDDFFISRGLQANSDLYIGVFYAALELDPSLVPVMIAVMRSPGMMAHWREAMSQPVNMWRPQQFYTGDVGGKSLGPPHFTTAGSEDGRTNVNTKDLEQGVDPKDTATFHTAAFSSTGISSATHATSSPESNSSATSV